MEKRKSAKFLLKMSHDEAQEIIEQRKKNKDSLISQIQFGRFARHCLNCEKCETEARKAGFFISGKS